MNSSLIFPFVAVLASTLAILAPELFVSFQSAIVPLLALIMFGMGMTLKMTDFLRVAQLYRVVLLGVGLQFTVMPCAAVAVSRLLDLPTDLAVGLIVVGSCAGGTASNVICYLAKADVALSITLTMVSTLLGVVATPLLTFLTIGERIDVPVFGMFISIAKIVIAPVVVGVFVNQYFGSLAARLNHFFPMLAMAAIVFIIAIIVSLNSDNIRAVGFMVFAAVALHNLIGLCGGYWLGRLFRYPQSVCRTLAIEVGMQNSGLGVALTLQYFSAAAALPGAIFSIWHNISGSLLAAFWSKRKPIIEQEVADVI